MIKYYFCPMLVVSLCVGRFNVCTLIAALISEKSVEVGILLDLPIKWKFYINFHIMSTSNVIKFYFSYS